MGLSQQHCSSFHKTDFIKFINYELITFQLFHIVIFKKCARNPNNIGPYMYLQIECGAASMDYQEMVCE